MSGQLLNASVFIENCNIIYNERFENILVSIISCYDLMKSNHCSLQDNENLIRDEMINNYLMNNEVRRNIGISDYLFYRELPTINNTGRVDILVVLRKHTFEDTNACYIIECKRLNNENTNGTTGLNAKYVNEGIDRFVSGKYPMYENTAGMIGFMISEIDIHKNIICMNQLLQNSFTEINTERELTQKKITPAFEYSYYSKHKAENTTKTIYHLMFNFSDNIKTP
jgi:hypothetical protein